MMPHNMVSQSSGVMALVSLQPTTSVLAAHMRINWTTQVRVDDIWDRRPGTGQRTGG